MADTPHTSHFTHTIVYHASVVCRGGWSVCVYMAYSGWALCGRRNAALLPPGLFFCDVGLALGLKGAGLLRLFCTGEQCGEPAAPACRRAGRACRASAPALALAAAAFPKRSTCNGRHTDDRL